ncbi:MAG: hypothetical protein HWD59_07030 [Coxiellaceae bacterium]|nr:MAG: hypothetical protein HWD59_07030 [Coxiellaceae bacterium]
MKNPILLAVISTLAASSASAFTIAVLPNNNHGTTSQNITVQCSQTTSKITLQMTCTLPDKFNIQADQLISEDSVLSFTNTNTSTVVGSLTLKGRLNYSNQSVILTNALATQQTSGSFNFVYTPSLQLKTPTVTGTSLNCNNIYTTTANCSVAASS